MYVGFIVLAYKVLLRRNVWCVSVIVCVGFLLSNSLWLTPTLASDGGFLLAKAKDGQLLYGLELRTLFAVVFSFRPPPPAVSCWQDTHSPHVLQNGMRVVLRSGECGVSCAHVWDQVPL